MRAPKSVKTAGATYLVANKHGQAVASGTLTAELSPVELVLPHGPDYLLSVNALGGKKNKPISLECEGYREFDVFRLKETRVKLTLDCSKLWPEEPVPEPPPMLPSCGVEALVVGPLRQLIGVDITADVTATPSEARLKWLTSDSNVGHFTHPDSDSVSQTEFTCDKEGDTTLTLVVSSNGCSDEASVPVTCVAWSAPDAGG